MCWPRTYSSTRYGWPIGDTPASIRRAIDGCVRRARIVPSRRKRFSPSRPTSDAFSSFDRRESFEAAVAAPRQPHRAHPAVTNRRNQRVGANLLSHQRRARGAARLAARGRQGTRCVRSPPAGRAGCRDRPRPPATACARRPGTPRVLRERDRVLVRVRTDSFPPGGIEGRHAASGVLGRWLEIKGPEH